MVGLVGVVAAGRVEQPRDLVHGQRLGKEPRLARKVEMRGDVAADQALAETEAVEALEGGCPPAEAGRREARIVRPTAPRASGEVVERHLR